MCDADPLDERDPAAEESERARKGAGKAEGIGGPLLVVETLERGHQRVGLPGGAGPVDAPLCETREKVERLLDLPGHALRLDERLFGAYGGARGRRLAQGKRELAGILAGGNRGKVGARPFGSSDLEDETPDLHTARDSDGQAVTVDRSSNVRQFWWAKQEELGLAEGRTIR